MAKRTIMDMEPTLHDMGRIANLIEIIAYGLPDAGLDSEEATGVMVMVATLLHQQQSELMEIWEEVRH